MFNCLFKNGNSMDQHKVHKAIASNLKSLAKQRKHKSQSSLGSHGMSHCGHHPYREMLHHFGSLIS